MAKVVKLDDYRKPSSDYLGLIGLAYNQGLITEKQARRLHNNDVDRTLEMIKRFNNET